MRKFYHALGVLLLLCPLHTQAQRLAVRGKVTSAADGSPLKSAQVELNISKERALTEKDGSYIIYVDQNFFNPDPAPALTFSAEGYEPITVDVIGRKRVDIALRPLGGQTAASFSTGISRPTAMQALPFGGSQLLQEQLGQAAPLRLFTAFEGQVPGLQVKRAGGLPGQDTWLQLRGITNLSGYRSPLIIVDGIYLNGSGLQDLNPEDVERIEILRGPASAASFGGLGGAGAIQVFTKNGSELASGETRLSYRHDFQMSEHTGSLPLNGFTNREILDPQGPQPLLGLPISSNTYTNPLPNLQDYLSDGLLQQGGIRAHTLSISGRSGGTYFRGAAQRMRDEGALQGYEGFTRHTFRANLGHEAGEKLKLSGSAYYANRQQDNGPAAGASPGQSLANTLLMLPVFGLNASNEEDGSAYDWDIDNSGAQQTNPLYLREQLQHLQENDRLMGHLGGAYAPFPWLSFDYEASLDRLTGSNTRFIDRGYLSTAVPEGFSPLITAGVQKSNGGGIEMRQSEQQYFTSTAGLSVHRSLLGFSMGLRTAFQYENQRAYFQQATGENLAVSGIRSLDNPQEGLRASSLRQEMTAYSGLMEADVNYKDKYIFSGALRAEQSALYGTTASTPVFYRVAAAYRLSEDLNLKIFQELKLRAAVGTAGLRPTFQQRFETFALANGTLSRQTLANDGLRPVLVREVEAGADLTFLRAFTLSATYVQRTAEGQIVLMPLSGGAGFEGQWRNAGSIASDIYEGSLHIDLKKLFRIPSSRVSWGIQAHGQRIRQEVSSLSVPPYRTGPGLPGTDLFTVAAGQPLGQMAGEVFITSVEQLSTLPDVNILEYAQNEEGFIVRADQLGTPEEQPILLTDEQGTPVLQPIGDINPEFQLGLSHTLTVGGLSLYAMAEGQKGGTVYNYTRQWLYAAGRHGDLSNSTLPASFYGPSGLANGLRPNAYFAEDASYVTIREAAISYTFNGGQLPWGNGLFQHIKLSLIGRNLFTWSPYRGYHPALSAPATPNQPLLHRQEGAPGSLAETPGGNPGWFALDFFNYPLRRSFGFSVQITL
ncbi:TonB-dependent receptor plug domain-containing protein [Phaeodactylibacter luteus]|uniref:TonB-dependent receptor plug domain-containing protein n=1 Tax=Phaeodactylibacter luteus TaxID=1564516 RepID=A0A5C6S2B1_9BACT|nr:TonB-dependent receptor plug domain-containing protein [Phaeodactylibacter luteus]TXB68375.1 hypothetical protein FRY97_03070 [Phaeodactylibacter luteus]